MDENKSRNPNILEDNKNTRFGSANGPDPSAAGKRGAEKTVGVRSALKKLACAEFDMSPGSRITPEIIAKKFGRDLTLTGAQMLAVRKFGLAMEGNAKLLAQVTDDIDGKQVQKTVEATVTLEQLVNGDYDGAEE